MANALDKGAVQHLDGASNRLDKGAVEFSAAAAGGNDGAAAYHYRQMGSGMQHYLKQSTASQSRLVGPFVDDTDFKTLETGLTIANTDVKLSKNGAAGVNKNSGGGTHRNNGMYSLTFDATDTDTVGELRGSISVAGALVVTFSFVVLEEAIYDALFGASADGKLPATLATADVTGNLPADVIAVSGDTTAADNMELDYDGTGYAKANSTIGTCTTNTDMLTTAAVNAEVDTALADIGLDHLLSAAVTGTDVTDNSVVAKLVSSSATADWDDFVNTTDSLQAVRDHIGDGTNLTEAGGNGDHLTEAGGTGDHLTAVPWNAAWDAEVQSEVNDGLVALGLDHLVGAAVVGTDVTDNSIIAKLVSSSATADWDDFVNTTDSLQAMRDHVGDGTNLTEAGGTGDHLTAVPWNAAWDTEVQSEVNDGLVALGLDHLVGAAVTGTDITDDSIIAKLVSSSATADWDDFVNTTDSLQAIRDNQGGSSANVTQILGTSLSETSAGYLAAAFEFFFDIATPSKTVNDVGVAGSGLTQQNVRDALKLAPTAGSPATGSVDKHLDDIQNKTDDIGTEGAVTTVRMSGSTMYLYTGETYTHSITTTSDFSAKTMAVEFTDEYETSVASVADGSLTKTSSSVSFAVPSAVTTSARRLNWSLRDTTGDEVLMYGTAIVDYAA